MADASRSPNSSNWSDVFATLPLEAPTASAWPAIAAQLDHKKAQARQRAWMALAASLFALTLLPMAWILRDAKHGAAIVATSPDTIARTPTTAVPSTTVRVDDQGSSPSITASSADRSAHALSIAANATRPVQAQNARRSAVRAQRRTTPALSAANVAQARDDADTTLETLYSASAQLETLLTFARDTRVESGPAAALAGAFDAELATIDAQLAQPGLATQQQQMLWQARVDTLQRSAGFESNLRLLAADGGRLDGALVSID